MSIHHRIARAWREVRANLAGLVLLEILVATLQLALIVPLSSLGLSWLIGRSGELALSNTEIAEFLGSPTGWLTALFVLVVTFFSFFVRAAGALRILASGEPSGVALGQVITLMPRLIGLALRQLFGYASILVPLVLIGLVTIPPLLEGHDINYYLQERPPAFWQAVGLAGGLATIGAIGVFVLFLRWLQSIPVLVLERLGCRASSRRSAELVGRTRWPLVGTLLAWGVALKLLAVVVAFGFGGFTSLLLGWAGLSLARLIPILALLLLAELLLAQVFAFLGISITFALVLSFYREARREEPIPGSDSRAPRFGNRGVAAVAAGAFLLAAVPTLLIYAEIEVREDAAITAHRGSSSRAPENSLSAITAAIEDGADFAEIDVQETADGQIVLLHDLDLMRVAGVDRRIWEIGLEELQTLDAGSWFAPEFAGERIPTLEEAIDLAGTSLRLNIELKFNGHEPNLVRRTVEIVRERGFESRCVVSSLSRQGLREVEALAPELETGLIVGASVGDITRVQVDFFSVNSSLIDYVLVSGIRDADKSLHAWTVNDPGEAWRLLTLGVDNLITDVPTEMVEARAEFVELSGAERLLLAFHHRVGG